MASKNSDGGGGVGQGKGKGVEGPFYVMHHCMVFLSKFFGQLRNGFCGAHLHWAKSIGKSYGIIGI